MSDKVITEKESLETLIVDCELTQERLIKEISDNYAMLYEKRKRLEEICSGF